MNIDKSLVKKIANLSRIQISDEEVDHYKQELSQILNWVEKLTEVDTDNVKPLRSVVESQGTVMRKDIVTEDNKQTEVLKNAPVSKYGCFVVPKVVE